MSLSFDALSPERKLVFLLEGLAGQDVQALLACRVCDRIFYNNRSLLIHFLSDHSSTDKGSDPRISHVRALNGPRFLLGGSHDMLGGGSAVRFTGDAVVPTTFSGKNSSTGSCSRTRSCSGRDRMGVRVLEEQYLFGRTSPYIRQLEVPIEERRVAGHEEISSNRLPDEMDLTMKL